MDIQEQMVLSNLELFRQRPHALPWHIKVPSGSVTVNDTVSPSFSITWPPTSRTAQIGPSRSVQLQWNVVPVTEGSQIRALADVYKSNVSDKDPGDPTLPPPTCQKPDQSPRYFSETFEEGKVPPLYRSHGYFNGTFIWVKDRPDAEDCFDQIVLATFAAAPVTSQDRGLLVPLGSQPTIGR